MTYNKNINDYIINWVIMLNINNIYSTYLYNYLSLCIFLSMCQKIFSILHTREFCNMMHAHHICDSHVRHLLNERFDFIYFIYLLWWLILKNRISIIMNNIKWFCSKKIYEKYKFLIDDIIFDKDTKKSLDRINLRKTIHNFNP